MRRIAILILLSLCLHCSLPAQEGNEETFIAEARQAIDDFRYQEAITILTSGIDSLGESDEDLKMMLAALELRAVCYFNLNQDDSVVLEFVRMIELSPDYELDSLYVPNAMRQLWAGEVERRVGSLELTVQPADAQVTIDGEQLNEWSGQPLNLLSGQHTIRAEAENYHPAEQIILIEAAKVANLSIELERSAATVQLRTRPAGVDVSINGEFIARTEPDPEGGEVSAPLIINGLETGSHRITVNRECFKESTTAVTVPRYGDYVIEEPLLLEENLATVVIPRLSSFTQVRINGSLHVIPENRRIEVCADQRLVIDYRSLYGNALLSVESPVEGAEYGSSVQLQPTVVKGPVYLPPLHRFGTIEEKKGYVTASALNADNDALSLRVSAVLDVLLDTMSVDQRFVSLTQPQFEVVQSLLAAEGAFFMALPLSDSSGAEQRIDTAILFNALYPVAERWSGPLPEPVLVDLSGIKGQKWSGMLYSPLQLADGHIVYDVFPGSPAAEAGIERGDIIASIDGLEESSAPAVEVPIVRGSEGQIKIIKPVTAPGFRLHQQAGELPATLYLASLALAEELELTINAANQLHTQKALVLMEMDQHKAAAAALDKVTLHPSAYGLNAGFRTYLEYKLSGKPLDGLQAESVVNDYTRLYHNQGLPLSRLLEVAYVAAGEGGPDEE